MTPASNDLNALSSDLHHLTTLIRVVTNLSIDIVDPDKKQCEQTVKEINQVSDLLWIARDMVEAITANSEAAHKRVLTERREAVAGGGVS